MTSHKINLGKSVKIKDGKLIKVHRYRDASHKVACRKSKRARVVRRTPS